MITKKKAIMRAILSGVIVCLLSLSFVSCFPPPPAIKYAEFPFELTYEIDGEIITVEDTYVCKFNGYGANAGTGIYREWKGYVKSTGEESITIIKDGTLTLVWAIGYPEYYMSDPTMPEYEYEPFAYYIIHPDEIGGTTFGMGDVEQFLEKYKIKLISWKLSDPIENSFE